MQIQKECQEDLEGRVKSYLACPSCGNRDPKKLTAYGKQLHCKICKNVYHMRDEPVKSVDEQMDTALQYLHCMNRAMSDFDNAWYEIIKGG